jgi:hypothetical protein
MKIFSILFLLTLSSLQAKGPYTMADLEALESERNYREFLDHALDIRPSERGRTWQAMVSSMAQGLIDFSLARQRLNRETWLYLDQISLWPVLQSDEFFQAKLANFVRQYLPHCLNEQKIAKELCAQDMVKYWRHSPRDPDLGIWLAQESERYKLGLPFQQLLDRVGQSDLSQFYCQRPIVQRHLQQELSQQILRRELKGENLEQFFKTKVNPTCWAKLAPHFKDIIERMEQPVLELEIAYLLLNLNDELTQAEQDFFLVRYLFNGPVVGVVFNLAWTRLKELSQNYNRRQVVFNQLKAMDHLPDALLQSPNIEQKSTILKYVHQQFPEYFLYYARTCLDYYQGTREFPRGNPTLHCGELFRLSAEENLPLVEQHLQIQYSGIKKAR